MKLSFLSSSVSSEGGGGWGAERQRRKPHVVFPHWHSLAFPLPDTGGVEVAQISLILTVLDGHNTRCLQVLASGYAAGSIPSQICPSRRSPTAKLSVALWRVLCHGGGGMQV